MNFLLKYKLIVLGILVGAVAGFAYYSTIGCVTGTCVITSRPVNSTLYGAVLGGLLFSMFEKETKTK
jgi:phage shock protein E